MPLIDVVEADITALGADVVVDEARADLRRGAGPSGAVRRAAGPDVEAACRTLRQTTLPHGLEAGYAVITLAGALKAGWVIHAVGPRYSPHEDRSEVLRSTYRRCVLLANAVGAKTVAFPLLSVGARAWPLSDAVSHAVAALGAMRCAVEVVTLVSEDGETADAVRRALAGPASHRPA